VIEAERTLLTVQRLDTQIRGSRANSTVALIRALGGRLGYAYDGVRQRSVTNVRDPSWLPLSASIKLHWHCGNPREINPAAA